MEDVIAIAEGIIRVLYESIKKEPLAGGIPRMDFIEAMEKYGTDKPDLRFGMEIAEISDALRNSELRFFRDVLDSGGTIQCIIAPRRGALAVAARLCE